MIGIATGNGYGIPFEERYALFRKAGFDSILLWWGNDEMATRVDRVWLAKAFDLRIENAHASTDNLNALWLEGAAGNRTCNRLLHEIDDCGEFGISTLVLHLTNSSNPPPVSAVGLNRVEYLFRLAEDAGVRLAFENVRQPEHTRYILDHYPLPHVGLCYDAGHAHFWTPDTDWLTMYRDRLFAVHLHDNDGTRDAHRIPFEGSIDWEHVMEKIAASSYHGCIAVESEYAAGGYESAESLPDYLHRAYAGGQKLEHLLQKYRNK